MKNVLAIVTGIVCAAGLCLPSPAPLAGHLEPPPGPVMPTDRVQLDDQRNGVPHTIDRPGSYVLTSDLRACLECDGPPTHGIVIDAPDVTLDLNGFAIVGAPGNSLSGIVLGAGHENIVIFNGVVRDWDGDGINLSEAPGSRVADVIASDNGGTGISIGFGGKIESCAASDNGEVGIAAAPGSVITQCVAANNGGDGFYIVPTAIPRGSTISNCSAQGNGGSGIQTGDGAVITGCAASVNASHGISTGTGCSITNNTTVTNGGDGILTYESLVHGNSSNWNTGANINATSSTVIDNHDGS